MQLICIYHNYIIICFYYAGKLQMKEVTKLNHKLILEKKNIIFLKYIFLKNATMTQKRIQMQK